MPTTNAHDHYQGRHRHFINQAARCRRRDARIALGRGVLFLTALALFVAWLMFGVPSPVWLLVPAVLFCVLVIHHQTVLSRLARAERGIAFHGRGLDRLAGRWDKIGPAGERYIDATHPYANDLDLFGTGSLFQRLWCGLTRLGEDRLAEWLLAPATIDVIKARHLAITELRPRHDLREKLGLLDVPEGEGNQNILRVWSGVPPRPVELPIRAAAYLLTGIFLATVILWLTGFTSSTWILVSYLACLVLSILLRRRVSEAIGRLDQAEAGLAPLQAVAALIERESFRSPCLQDVLGRLSSEGQNASHRIDQLHALTHRFDSTIRNQFVAMFAIALGLPIHLAHAAETWRARFGSHVPRWLEAVGEFEALLSIAGYAAENPGDSFPALLDGPPQFHATGLGHPLLPAENCIRNELSLGLEPRLLVISGSNMAGKSTLLRSVGLAAVLAQAGAPVRATVLEMTPLQIGTVIRVSDSLQSGKSYFLATIERLKRIATLAAPGGEQSESVPLLFLLDELLAGTNSHDRRIGAEEILRRLLERGAIGIVTTHDLALTEIADDFAPAATNWHFRDEFIDDQMHFDYTLRPGRVARGNALALMRLVGLMEPEEELIGSAKQ